MHRISLRSLLWLTASVASLCCVPLNTSAQFHPREHALEGLPDVTAPQLPYSDRADHWLNRLHGLLFSESLVPADVHQQLPTVRSKSGTTDAEFFVKGWYFQNKNGTEEDRQTFGGDVRVSPRQSFTTEERTELMKLLAQLNDAHRLSDSVELREPLMRLMLQWDILSVWWQLERKKSPDSAMLAAMARAIQALAQDADVLVSLPSGLEALSQQFDEHEITATGQPYLPRTVASIASADGSAEWLEVGRRSTLLFNAERSLRVSKAYLSAGSAQRSREIIQQVGESHPAGIELPDGTQTMLIMHLIGLDRDLNPVATPVIDELRVRAMVGPAELKGDNPTSSRDGSNHWVYMRTRAGSRLPDAPDFRFVPDTAQALFLEYGTRKHATYAAQCALCHRRTNDGGQTPGGIRMLSQTAKPHVAEKDEREKLALAEMTSVVQQLKSRLKPVEATEDNPENEARLPARPVRKEAERQAWVERLKQQYHQPADQWPKPHVDTGVAWKEIGPLPKLQHPQANPFNPDKKQLGEMLFFDPRLSGSQQIACASCHDPDLGWADGKTLSFGHSRLLLARNAPTIRNTGYFEHLFWDGRAASLEDQVLQVLSNPSEMRANEVDVISRLREHPEYQTMFELAFGDPAITFDRIAQAIACFERTIVGGSSRFDAFVKGKYEILTDSELIGLDLYRRDARCINCHNGPLFSDNQFHNVGLSYYGRKFQDLGKFTITNQPADVGKFRTPSLRDITRTAPLMHNGLFELPGVLNMYNAGMPTLRPKVDELSDPNFPIKSVHLKPLGLNRDDLKDLAAFLGTLEEPKRRIWPPRLPGMPEPKIQMRP